LDAKKGQGACSRRAIKGIKKDGGQQKESKAHLGKIKEFFRAREKKKIAQKQW